MRLNVATLSRSWQPTARRLRSRVVTYGCFPAGRSVAPSGDSGHDALWRMEGVAMRDHEVGTRERWLAARKELLTEEKELFRRGDELAKKRQRLPWVPVGKEYLFDTEAGQKSLAELFAGRPQLMIYHFMFGEGFNLTPERQGCTGCSLVADHFDAVIPHLNGGRNVTFVAASIAPLRQLLDYKRQMGWGFPWVSSAGSDFNYDFGVAFTEDQQANGAEYNYAHVEHPPSQREGMSTFVLADGVVHHTYSSYSRGVESLMGIYQYLDLAPFGRDENDLEYKQAWWRRHDEYPSPQP